jgi:hypothetical protein
VDHDLERSVPQTAKCTISHAAYDHEQQPGSSEYTELDANDPIYQAMLQAVSYPILKNEETANQNRCVFLRCLKSSLWRC